MGRPVTTRTSSRLFRDALDEPVHVAFDRLREMRPRDLMIRFVFGFVVSVIAGGVTLAVGDRAGGLFLAFPAILPASLTLIAEKEGDSQAEVDAGGALLGAFALVAFAVVSWQALGRVPLVPAELAAAAAWLAVSVGAYFAIRRAMRRRAPNDG
jgi:hypothetical protein